MLASSSEGMGDEGVALVRGVVREGVERVRGEGRGILLR